MSQSTPLNMLRRGGDDSQMSPQMPSGMPAMPSGGGSMDSGNMMADSQLVEDILKEMGEGPGAEHQSNINSQAFQYTMDSSQVPPTKYTPPTNMQYPTPNGGGGGGGVGAEYTQHILAENASNGLLSSIGINLSGASLKDKIMNNLKYPVLVFIICFLISLPEFNRFLFGFFPRLLLESGQVSIGGVILKAVVGMILYSCIVMFI
jgi:hypothetical protein